MTPQQMGQVIVGGVVLVALLIFAAFRIYQRHKKGEDKNEGFPLSPYYDDVDRLDPNFRHCDHLADYD